MSCPCAGTVSWDDDAPEMCEECYAQQVAEMSRFEPPNDPQPRELLPDPNSLPIHRHKPNQANVQRIAHTFCGMLDHIRETPRDGEVTEADTLGGIELIMRQFTVAQVLDRALLNPTAAVTNRVAIVHVLHKLIDEILKLDLPNPVVN